ncbi:MAG TPA: hypothetical protein VGL70_19845 [Candidatus Binatia bacterium]|jgi:hypothetical protein
MLSNSKLVRGTWAVAVIAWALLFTGTSLSLDSDFNLEIPLSQSGHSFVGKINKDPRQNHGGLREMVAAATWLHWAPSFHPHSLELADPERPPALRLLRSSVVRAPPFASL